MTIRTTLNQILATLQDNVPSDRLWSTKELARYFGVHANSVDTIISDPKFPRPTELLGDRTRRWQPEEVKQWFCNKPRA